MLLTAAPLVPRACAGCPRVRLAASGAPSCDWTMAPHHDRRQFKVVAATNGAPTGWTFASGAVNVSRTYRSGLGHPCWDQVCWVAHPCRVRSADLTAVDRWAGITDAALRGRRRAGAVGGHSRNRHGQQQRNARRAAGRWPWGRVGGRGDRTGATDARRSSRPCFLHPCALRSYADLEPENCGCDCCDRWLATGQQGSLLPALSRRPELRAGHRDAAGE